MWLSSIEKAFLGKGGGKGKNELGTWLDAPWKEASEKKKFHDDMKKRTKNAKKNKVEKKNTTDAGLDPPTTSVVFTWLDHSANV
jgi:hypothetical protein